MNSVADDQTRYYVHGDELEDRPYMFYCASCDQFVPPSYFDDKRHTSSRAARYDRSLSSWRGIVRNYPGKYRRPADASNLVVDEVAADKRKAGAARSKFFRWLIKQVKRKDPIGDLSRDAVRDSEFPVISTSPEQLRSHLRHCKASDNALVALDEALLEFEKAPKERAGLSLTLRFSVFKRNEYRCQLCGGTAKEGKRLEVDHKVAVANGGTDDVLNLWTLCFECNRGKRTCEL